MGGGTCLADSLTWRGRGTPDRRDSLRASRLCRVRFCWWRASSPEYRWCIEGGDRGPEVQKSKSPGTDRHRRGEVCLPLSRTYHGCPTKGSARVQGDQPCHRICAASRGTATPVWCGMARAV